MQYLSHIKGRLATSSLLPNANGQLGDFLQGRGGCCCCYFWCVQDKPKGKSEQRKAPHLISTGLGKVDVERVEKFPKGKAGHDPKDNQLGVGHSSCCFRQSGLWAQPRETRRTEYWKLGQDTTATTVDVL